MSLSLTLAIEIPSLGCQSLGQVRAQGGASVRWESSSRNAACMAAQLKLGRQAPKAL